MKEILFAQRLADNEEKVRERTLKHLRKFLSAKTLQTPGQSRIYFKYGNLGNEVMRPIPR